MRTRKAKKPSVNPPSSCAKFAEELADRLYNTVVLGGGYNPESRHDLANAMHAQALSNVDLRGVSYNKQTYPIDGFKQALTDNGQLADAYRHIIFGAGNALHGTAGGDASNLGAKLSDYYGIYVQGRAESETELRDDAAGIEVGGLMLNTALAGRSGDYAKLKAEIKAIVCAY